MLLLLRHCLPFLRLGPPSLSSETPIIQASLAARIDVHVVAFAQLLAVAFWHGGKEAMWFMLDISSSGNFVTELAMLIHYMRCSSKKPRYSKGGRFSASFSHSLFHWLKDVMDDP